MSVTASDVAARAGVSVSTVSRVLNDKPGVSAETRRRVLDAVRELHYVPDVAARGLATAHMQNVGFVVYKRPLHLSANFSLRIMQGVEEELTHHGYHAVLAALEPTTSPSNLKIVRESRVDGLILIGPRFSPRSILELKNAGFPIVLIDNALNETKIDSVLCDNRDGAYEAAKHLIGHGHSVITFICGPDEWVSNRERCAGYRQAMNEAGLEYQIFSMPDTTIDTGYEALMQALGVCPSLTAVCAVNDAMAIGAIRALKEVGYQVPDDVAITGFDDISWAALNEPPLTTVHIYLEEIGRFAARRLVDLIEGSSQVPTRISLATKLLIRQSCGCP
ncbi:MAG: LacI family DNA-binding transcriptional regulator [Chloroflexota bacterium]|nr:LacI family DNA-binding transcriptional regulator [Chloroflexota bacterium]